MNDEGKIVERFLGLKHIEKCTSAAKWGDEWLNDLMICYVEKQIFRTIGNEQIMQHFEEMKKRRMLLPKQNVVVCPVVHSFPYSKPF